MFLALKCLKDIELQSHLQAADLGLDRQTDMVTGPHNVLGIEPQRLRRRAGARDGVDW
ncbi:MAG: hypothetical protein IPN53_24715 [Comamonadaceae bacterium]|nr:hypothetical protein [Comamonadaceae bacterium]